MYKRKLNQVSLYDDLAMFGGIPLNPENEWIKLAKIIPWWGIEQKYAELFPSNTGQPACSLRMALGSQNIKKMCPERTAEYIRKDRTKAGHMISIRYIAKLVE